MSVRSACITPSMVHLPENQKNPNHPIKDEKGSRGATLITRRGRSLYGYGLTVDIPRC